MLKINNASPIANTSKPDKNKKAQSVKKNDNRLLLGSLAALSALGLGAILFHGRNISKIKKTDAPDAVKSIICDINESAIKTKEAVADLAAGSILKQKNKTCKEFSDSIENYYDTLEGNWAKWQRNCDSLKFNSGHKAIFEYFALSPKQLSDVHRDIESLHMSILSYSRTLNPEYEELIPLLASKILKDGSLEELTKLNNKTVRNDIINDKNQWQQFWRNNFRDIDRPTSNIKKLKEILKIS